MIQEAKTIDNDNNYMTLDASQELINCTELQNRFDIINASWLYNYTKDKNELLLI